MSLADDHDAARLKHGEALCIIRRDYGLTIPDTVRKSGLTEEQIGRIEAGGQINFELVKDYMSCFKIVDTKSAIQMAQDIIKKYDGVGKESLNLKTIGGLVRALRLQQKPPMSQEQLGEASETSQSHISRLENGIEGTASEETLIRIIHALGHKGEVEGILTTLQSMLGTPPHGVRR